MKTAKLLIAAAIPLALAACSSESDGSKLTGDPIAKVAAPAGKQWTDVVVKTDEGYKMGNANAKLQLVEYGAITCPGCAQFSVESTEELMAMVNTGTIAFEFRPFLVHGVQDIPGFLLAQCNGPEAFFPLIDQLYANQESWLSKLSTITDAEQQQLAGKKPTEIVTFLGNKFELVDFVKARGVSEDAAKKCLADGVELEKLTKVTEAASKAGTVTGTPTLILNGGKMSQASWAEVKAALKNAGAR